MSSKKSAYDEYYKNSEPFNTKHHWEPFRKLTKDLIVFKKVRPRMNGYIWVTKRDVIIALMIPKGSVVHCHGPHQKCRANRAVVLDTYEQDQGDNVFLTSQRSAHFKYIQNKVVRPVMPFSFRQGDCESGIHFFLTPSEAMKYYY